MKPPQLCPRCNKPLILEDQWNDQTFCKWNCKDPFCHDFTYFCLRDDVNELEYIMVWIKIGEINNISSLRIYPNMLLLEGDKYIRISANCYDWIYKSNEEIIELVKTFLVFQ